MLLGLATGGFLMLPGAGLGIRGTAAIIFVLTHRLGRRSRGASARRLRRGDRGQHPPAPAGYRADVGDAALGLRPSATRCPPSSCPTIRRRSCGTLDNIVAVEVARAEQRSCIGCCSHADAGVRARALGGAGARPVTGRPRPGGDGCCGIRIWTCAPRRCSTSRAAAASIRCERIEQLGDFARFLDPRRDGRVSRRARARLATRRPRGCCSSRWRRPPSRATAPKRRRVLAIVPEPPTDLLTTLILDEDPEVAEQAMKTAHIRVRTADAVDALGASLMSGLFEAERRCGIA